MITATTLWRYEKTSRGINRTARFELIEVTSSGVEARYYRLSYAVLSPRYNMTVRTVLTPLDSGAYNASLTTVRFAPAGKLEELSMEVVELNSTVTLSQLYSVLGKVVGKVRIEYKRVGSEELVDSYRAMRWELEHLSRLAKRELRRYDREVLKSWAVLRDDVDAARELGEIGGLKCVCYEAPRESILFIILLGETLCWAIGLKFQILGLVCGVVWAIIVFYLPEKDIRVYCFCGEIEETSEPPPEWSILIPAP